MWRFVAASDRAAIALERAAFDVDGWNGSRSPPMRRKSLRFVVVTRRAFV
jgi:hypothetical protein